MLEAFRLGVKEFLPQPLTRQEVEPALTRFEERFKSRELQAETKAGSVVCVIGVGGGIGTSTVAANLAMSVQQTAVSGSVGLVDLDLHGSGLELFLDLPGGHGLRHLCTDVSRLDETIVRTALQQHPSGVNFLPSGYEAFGDIHHAEGNTMRVLALLRLMHRHVVVDGGHILEPAVKEALDCADKVLVVTSLSLASVRRAKRLLQVFRAANYSDAKVQVVVNRYEKHHAALLRETEDLLGVKMFGLIPNDYPAATEAINQGKPAVLLAPRTSIAKWYLQQKPRLFAVDHGSHDSSPSLIQESKNGSFLGRCMSSLRLETVKKTSIA
jgi:pilus assembly protein CpaE